MQTYQCDKEYSQKMFGINPDNFLDRLKKSNTYQRNGALSYAARILSDVQELIEANDLESARQQINLAKLVIFEVKDGNLLANVPRQ